MINARRQRMRILHAKVHRQSAYAADRLGGINPPLISFKRSSVRSVLVWSFSCHSRQNKTEPRHEPQPCERGFMEGGLWNGIPVAPPKEGAVFSTVPPFGKVTMAHPFSTSFYAITLPQKNAPRLPLFKNSYICPAGSKTFSFGHNTHCDRTVYSLTPSGCHMSHSRWSLPA